MFPPRLPCRAFWGILLLSLFFFLSFGSEDRGQESPWLSPKEARGFCAKRDLPLLGWGPVVRSRSDLSMLPTTSGIP